MPRTLEQQIANRCIHFTGISNVTCKAGVCYKSVRDDSTCPYRWPCLKDDEAGTTCEHALFPTAEEVSAEVDDIKRETSRTMTAMAAVMDEAKRLGLKKGNGGRASIPCPVCQAGTLCFTVASYNGHVWGKCSTDDCVAWMQ